MILVLSEEEKKRRNSERVRKWRAEGNSSAYKDPEYLKKYNQRPEVKARNNSRYHIARKEATSLLGGKCIFCGSKINLQLHHRMYDKSYPKRRKVNGKLTGYRLNPTFEAAKHPERFRLLCHKCHNVVTYGLHDVKRTKLVFKKIGKESGFENNVVKKIISELGKV